MITFIVGTDTDVGKTFYGKKLISDGYKVIKPIETGKISFDDINMSDSYQYANLQGLDIDNINLYFFNNPVSPHLASKIDDIEINVELLKNFIRSNDGAFVEMAGGLFVPITRNYTQLDLIKEIENARVHLVIENKLGCINHALLTIEILKQNDILISNIYFNNKSKKENYLMKENIKVILDYYGKK